MAEDTKKIVIYSRLTEQYGWLRSIAAKLGFEVFAVEDGSVAVDKAKSELPSFVILDVSMPKISGIECCTLIKQVNPATKVILISTLHSLSLQDGAKDALVDLFVVDTVASVKVPEFIEASLSKKELPPEAAEEIEREVLSKRGAQRFPFEGEVQFKIGDNWFSGVLVNVSQDGLLFQTQTTVALGTNLLLSWMDHGLKHVEVTALAVRQFSSTHLQYPFMIGVQFLKSSPILDQKIAEMSDEVDIFQEGADIELDLDLIEQLLSSRGTYFRDLFQGGKAPLFVEFSIADIVEHERASFHNKDEYALCMQEIVSSKIICQLVENSANQIGSQKNLPKQFSTRLLTLISELMEKIEFVEDDSDALVKKSIQDGMVNERRQLNESNNRLYLAKAAVLNTFCKKITRDNIPESFTGGYDEIVKQNNQLTSYQQHLDEISKQEEVDRKQTIVPKPAKPIEIPTPKTDLYASVRQDVGPATANAKKNIPILLYAAGLVVLLTIIPFVKEKTSGKITKDDFALVTKPTSIVRASSQSLIVNLPKQAWEDLGERGRKAALDQIEIYLTKKDIHQCKIMDGDQTLAAVYSTISNDYPGFLRTEFLTQQAEVAQPKTKTINEPAESASMDENEPLQESVKKSPSKKSQKSSARKKKHAPAPKKRIKIH